MKKLFSLLAVAALSAVASTAWATVEQVKLYKEAYPDTKPKCIDCHVDKLPKKDAAHDLNEYGKKVAAIKAEPDAETYKQAGPISS